ncbi:major facilitator superfamily domain-containing protein [Boeremia exigua]|uniref:major facilitator superfamily domain-containing protein n=1 Tax=Boeremia exigua TaxID=749465 RepID=UPI001E8DD9C2|nr:major facilitator superfamily domain-containing protein [Boeremia exigua]KAH6639486.1 major facilitator superfamily domain-containing protein [Boeremia exigua]
MATKTTTKPTTKYTIPLVYLTSFLFLFGETLQPAPRIAIYESIVCQQHYASPGPHDCKIAPVQEELAFLGGIERLSIIIPSILAIPFAALADRYGHSLILAIAVFGVFLEDGWPFLVCWFPEVFPIRLIWLHFVFSCIGGGFTVVVTLLHVIIADVVSAEVRTTMFFRARAAGVGASILGYAASGFLMRTSEFLPWAVGLVSLILGTVTATLIPRTTVQKDNESHGDGAVESWSMRSSLEALRNIASILLGDKQILAMLLLVFVCQLGFDSVPLMLAIYVSKRFGWSFSNASFLSSLEMGVEFLALAFVLPVLTSSLPAAFQKASAFAKDKLLALWSLAALAIGTICLGVAPVVGIAIAGIVVLALGSGQDSLTRSMATEMVHTGRISTMYSAITMLRAIGGSVSGPMYAWLYSTGLKQRGDVWLGLPYLVAGALFVTAVAVLIFIRNAKDDATDEEAREPLLG